MSRRTAIIIAAAAIAASVAAVYAAFDPMQAQWMPKCPVYALTGWKCPGCGSQRMLHALMSGDVGGAFHSNPCLLTPALLPALTFLLCMLPVIALLLLAEIWRRSRPKLYARLFSPAVIAVMFTAIILWTVVRNIFGL